MKQRILTLAALACMLLTLAACGGGEQTADPGTTAPAQTTAPAAMSKEDYQAEVENLSADIADSMTAMGSLSITDEESARTGVDTLRSMAQPFRDFAAIPNPPEEWAEGHGKIAEGCTLFADSLEGLCDSAIGVLDGEMDQEAYAAAITDYSTSLTDAATLITEGLGMLEM